MCKGREGSKDSKDDVQPSVHTQTLPRQDVTHSPAIRSSMGFIFLKTSSCSSYRLKSIVIEPPWHSSPWRIKGCCSLPVSGEVRLGFEKDNSTVIPARAPESQEDWNLFPFRRRVLHIVQVLDTCKQARSPPSKRGAEGAWIQDLPLHGRGL